MKNLTFAVVAALAACGWTVQAAIVGMGDIVEVTSSGSYNADTPPTKLFDGDSETAWLSGSNAGIEGFYVQVQLKKPLHLTSYTIIGNNQYITNQRRMPKTFKLLGSNNGVIWEELDSQVNQSDWSTTTEGKRKTYAVSKEESYIFYRLSLIEAVTYQTYRFGFGEWLLEGTYEAGDDPEPEIPEGTWRYEMSSGCITDGDWVLSTVLLGANGLQIKAILTTGTNSVIDLSSVTNLPCPIVELADSCFKANAKIETVKLPPTLKSIGALAFYNSTSLTNVVPFLPDSVTTIGAGAFKACPVENDLVLSNPELTAIPDATSNLGAFANVRSKNADLSQSGIISIGSRAFESCTSLESIKFPATLETLSFASFSTCTSLANVEPFLPDAVSSIGQMAFYGCPVTNDFILTNPQLTTLPGEYASYGPFTALRSKLMDFSKSGLTSISDRAFKAVTGIERVNFPETLTSIGAVAFYGCTGVREMSFLSYADTLFNRDRPFEDFAAGDYKVRFLYPKTSDAWKGRIQSDATFVPWDGEGGVGADTQAIYNELFTDGLTPAGAMTFNKRRVWVVPVSSGAGIVDLVVSADPEEVGAPGPDYGSYPNVGEQVPLLCTNTLFGATETTGYSNVCCRLEKMGDEWWELVEAVPGALSYSFDPPEDGTYRIRWQWQGVGYALALPEATQLGHVMVAGETVPQLAARGDYYVSNSVVRLTAVDDMGEFERWYGDVPAGHETDNPLEITMDGAKSLSESFRAVSWLYDAEARTICDGDWTLSVTAEGNELKVVGVVVNGREPTLDLSLKTRDGSGAEYAVVEIGDNVFMNNAALSQTDRPVLVKFPEGLRSIGSKAFAVCTGMICEPTVSFKALTNLGQHAFYCCTAITSAFEIGCEVETVALGIAAFGGEQNLNMRISGLKLGKGVKSIPNYFAQRWASAAKIELPDTLTSIGEDAFLQCNSISIKRLDLGNVTSIGNRAFFGCATMCPEGVVDLSRVSSLGNQCFYACNVMTNTIVIGTRAQGLISLGSEAFAPSSGGTAFQGLIIGEGAEVIPESFCYNCSGLTTLMLPSSVKGIAVSAFRYGHSISGTIDLGNELVTLRDDAFGCYSAASQPAPVTFRFHTYPENYGTAAFRYRPGEKVRFYIPRRDETWAAALDGAVERWKDITDESVRQAYAANFPDGVVPYGRLTKAAGNLPSGAWIVRWTPPEQATGMMLLVR